VDYQEEYSRFLPIVKLILLIPHIIVLYVLLIIAEIMILIAFFAVLFTGRYPEGMFNFVVGVQRWGYRVAAYALLMTDKYPSFTLEADPSDTVRYTVEYPSEGIARWRPLVNWLLALPVFVIAYVILYVVEILVVIAFFAILFTKKYPRGLFNFARGSLRLSARAGAFAGFMTEKYPPFDLQ
jgi:hypothetical protein